MVDRLIPLPASLLLHIPELSHKFCGRLKGQMEKEGEEEGRKL